MMYFVNVLTFAIRVFAVLIRDLRYLRLRINEMKAAVPEHPSETRWL